ncbi:MAG: hypothetical protein KDD69_04200, partial [Bdellovibrionales bacterium]|nr:hypothetical protein [Bdellovibrionales bacterium]
MQAIRSVLVDFRCNLITAATRLATALLLSAMTMSVAQADTHVGVWNGFNNHTVVAEITNLATSKADLSLSMVTSDGQALGAEQFSIEAGG